MKTLHFDCFAGISGDMTLGALVDLGLDPEDLRRELEKLGLPGWKLDFRREERRGIHGTRALVELEGRQDHEAHDDDDHDHHHEHDHEHHHDHDHDHEHHHDHEHDHHHEHEHPHEHHHGHVHRSWRDIRGLIEGSGIGGGAKRRALDIFRRIAEAESQVHGVPVEDIGFHEVGALDSIIDIVGAAVGLELLRPDRITAGEIELGGGTVRCAHGILPAPAPATLILCRGLPVRTGGFDREMTTPTGAAILAASVDEFITGPCRFTEVKTGYGIGTRKMDRLNALRVSWREEEDPGARAGTDLIAEELLLIETNIDDMSGEALGFLMERLFEGGALDVTLSPCVMKKSRPGTIVSVLCPPHNREALGRILLTHSTTIGFREIPIRRLSLRREAGTLAGEFGGARTKTVFRDGQALRTKIEFEDRARLARERGISLADAEELIKKGSPG